jgi:hypothetical protein
MTTGTEEAQANRVSFKGWLPAQEAADYLGISREYIYRLKNLYDEGSAGVPGFMLGAKSSVLMFRVTDLDAYARTHPDLGKRTAAAQSRPESGEEAAVAF